MCLCSLATNQHPILYAEAIESSSYSSGNKRPVNSCPATALRSKHMLHTLLDRRTEISVRHRAHHEQSDANKLAPESQRAWCLSQKPSCFLSCEKKKRQERRWSRESHSNTGNGKIPSEAAGDPDTSLLCSIRFLFPSKQPYLRRE